MPITVKIDGMHCDGCVRSVEKAASQVEGVSAVTVDLQKGEMTAEIVEPAQADRLVAAIEETGFDARLQRA